MQKQDQTNKLSIDRLSLQVPGLTEPEGRRLAVLVAQGLGSLGPLGGGREVPTLRLDLEAPPSAGVDELARRIVAELARQVARLP
jgi:hypothetical protein